MISARSSSAGLTAPRWSWQSGRMLFCGQPAGPHFRFNVSPYFPQAFPCRRVSNNPLGAPLFLTSGQDSGEERLMGLKRVKAEPRILDQQAASIHAGSVAGVGAQSGYLGQRKQARRTQHATVRNSKTPPPMDLQGGWMTLAHSLRWRRLPGFL
jgi:hypothetical protein